MTTKPRMMTANQEQKIIMLAAQLKGSFVRTLTDAVDVLPVGKSAIRQGLTLAEASQIIDDLQRQITEKPEAEPDVESESKPESTPVATGTLTADDILSMLGNTVEIVYAHTEGTETSERTVTGTVDSIVPSSKDRSPALRFASLGKTIRANLVTAWRVL